MSFIDVNNKDFDNIKNFIGYEQFELIFHAIIAKIDDIYLRDKVINALKTKTKSKYNQVVCQTCNTIILTDTVILNDKETQAKSTSAIDCSNQTDLHSIVVPGKFILIDDTPIEDYKLINNEVNITKNNSDETFNKKKEHKVKRHSYLRPHAKKTTKSAQVPANGLTPKAVKCFNDSVNVTAKQSAGPPPPSVPSPKALKIMKNFKPICPKPKTAEDTKNRNNHQVFDNLVDKLPILKDETIATENSNLLKLKNPNSDKIVVNSNNGKLVKFNGKIINTMPKNTFKFIKLSDNKVKIVNNEGTILKKGEVICNMLPSAIVNNCKELPGINNDNNNIISLEHSKSKSTSELSLEPSLNEPLLDTISNCSSIPNVSELDQYINQNNGSIEIPGKNNIDTSEALKLQIFKEWQLCNTLIDGYAIIHNAIISNNIHLLRRQCAVIKSRQLNINILDKQNRTPLELAIRNIECSADFIELLLQHNADVNILQDVTNNTMLHVAGMYTMNDKKYDIILNALKHKINDYNDEGYTALYYAITYPDIEKVKSLINAGADINRQDCKSGKTALFSAVEADLYEIVQLLLKSGANININTYSNMSIFDALTELDNVSLKTKNLIVRHAENVNKRLRPDDAHKKLNSNYKKRRICATKTS